MAIAYAGTKNLCFSTVLPKKVVFNAVSLVYNSTADYLHLANFRERAELLAP